MILALLKATGSLGLCCWQILLIFGSTAGQAPKKPVWGAVALCIYYLQGIRQVLGALPGPSPWWLVEGLSRVAKAPGKTYLPAWLPAEPAHLVLGKRVVETQLLFSLRSALFLSLAAGSASLLQHCHSSALPRLAKQVPLCCHFHLTDLGARRLSQDKLTAPFLPCFFPIPNTYFMPPHTP